jgi:hypothetical protein
MSERKKKAPEGLHRAFVLEYFAEKQSIDLHINNCTALSVKILDNVPQCMPYSNFSL